MQNFKPALNMALLSIILAVAHVAVQSMLMGLQRLPHNSSQVHVYIQIQIDIKLYKHVYIYTYRYICRCLKGAIYKYWCVLKGLHGCMPYHSLGVRVSTITRLGYFCSKGCLARGLFGQP